MSTCCRKNTIGYLYKSFIIPTCEIHLGWLTVTFTYCTDTFYLLLIYYICYIYSLCKFDIGKNNM